MQLIEPELHDQIDGRVVALGQPVAEHFVEHPVEHCLGLRLIEHAELRVEPRLDGMGPKQRTAEGVDRADPRGVHFPQQVEPIADLLAVGIEQPLPAGRADPVAHLAGGTLGKRDRHQLAQPGNGVAAVVFRFQANKEPLGEHERLAAAGARRKRHRGAPRRNRRVLLIGQSWFSLGHVFPKARIWWMRQTVAKGQ